MTRTHKRSDGREGEQRRRCFRIASSGSARGSSNGDRVRIFMEVQDDTGAPEEIRTPDPQIRSLRARRVLAHSEGLSSENSTSPG
jgi:hypothetical protein